MKLIKRSGLLIPKEYDNTEAYVKIKEKLQRRTKEFNTPTYTYNIFYIESEKFLLVPRNFPIHKYTFDTQIEDRRHEGTPIELEHNIIPRSNTQKKAIKYLMTHESGILQLSPGVGKTVITIYMIAERKLKSLVLVHRDSLVDQWKERFLEFTNIKENDIARLRSATFQKDLQKPIILSTVQTFISLLKRKRKDFLFALNDANIGVFVGDEVHTSVGAPTFSECSIHIPSKYTYGLSATPYRYDGNGDIIQYHLGDIFADDDVEGTMSAKVSVILLDYQIDTAKSSYYIHWGGKFQRARYLNQMRKSKPFRVVLRGLLTRLKKTHNLICFIERIKIIDDFFKWLKFNSKSKFCGTAKMDTLNSKVTFATPGKCRDGIDAPWKDCVVITSPILNIEQLTGRVVRTAPGKQTPSIIDMVDYGCSDMSGSFFGRRQFYQKKGWEIQYILFVNGKKRVIDEKMAFEIIKGE